MILMFDVPYRRCLLFGHGWHFLRLPLPALCFTRGFLDPGNEAPCEPRKLFHPNRRPLLGSAGVGSHLFVVAPGPRLLNPCQMYQDKSLAVSYAIFILIVIAVGAFHLTTVFVTILFASLALRALSFGKYKWVSIGLFLIFLCVLFYGFAFFVRHAVKALPEIASTTIPVIVRFATDHGIVLPFTDMESLKSLLIESIHETAVYLGGYAGVATKEFLFVIVGVVVAISIFINPTLDFDQSPRPLNIYSLHCARVAELFDHSTRTLRR